MFVENISLTKPGVPVDARAVLIAILPYSVLNPDSFANLFDRVIRPVYLSMIPVEPAFEP